MLVSLFWGALRARGRGGEGCRVLVGEHTEIDILITCDHQLATEARQDLRQHLEVESLPCRRGLLECLGQDLGEPVGIAAGLLRQSVVDRAGPIADFLDSTSCVGLRGRGTLPPT